MEPKRQQNSKRISNLWVGLYLDSKTVRIFAYSSTREQSNKRSGVKLKTESETGVRACEARALRACEILKLRLSDFEKRKDCFAV